MQHKYLGGHGILSPAKREATYYECNFCWKAPTFVLFFLSWKSTEGGHISTMNRVVKSSESLAME
ncbi:hypothetical protein PFISCL1PPCAC_24191 [Pristionchus fissidentatus]|uniref:Uncharacterized protein n=1 Tax=Pristionchus fissidentatus TaxID=1538716 RepID=A0AAV5WQD0_9BILA|nr:hypothetical protein PFISCL1PPCAC_24191 [Pristionchus fissidentatus]